MKYLFIALLVVSSIVIIVTTLMMEPKTRAGAMFGQDSNVHGTSMHKSKDDFLNKVVIIFGIVFGISLIGLLAL